MFQKKGEEYFDPVARRLVGHKFTDISAMRRGILEMCRDMGLAKGLGRRPISEEGFLENQEAQTVNC
jgi:hypothetical protein